MKKFHLRNLGIFLNFGEVRERIVRINWLHRLLLPIVQIALLPRQAVFKLTRIICFRRFHNNQMITVKQSGIKSTFLAVSETNYWDIWRTRKEMRQYLNHGLKTGDIAYDIGANVGTYTIPMSKFVGDKGVVLAFEPDPTSWESLMINLKINAVNNCKTYRYCIGNENKNIQFYVRPDKDTHSIFEKSSAPSPMGELLTISSQMKTLDQLVKTGEAPQPNFIKLDIEGAELLALDGMRQVLKSVRAIYIECHNALKVDLLLGEPVPLVTEKLFQLGAKKVVRTDTNHVIGYFGNE